MRALLFGILLSSVNLLFSQETGANRIEADNGQLLYSTSSIDPKVQSFDKTKSVGQIPIQHSMVNGALTYIIPIEVYPGSKNMQPGISLTYNSFLKDGVAGYGWNIGGLSSISVVNHNQYFDGFTAESKSEKGGAYMLDGNRLIKISESGNIITYETEQNKIKVTGYPGNNTFEYFRVEYPNGQTATYGKSGTTTGKLSYPLFKIEDLHGNYIEYNNLYYVTNISYGAKNQKTGSVQFTYANRSNTPIIYTNGIEIKQSRYLKSISTFFNETKVKTYTLTHDNTDALLLKQVDCSNNQNEFLNPVIFHYGDEANEISISFESKESNLAAFELKPEHKIEDIPMIKGQFDILNTGLLLFPAPDNPYGVLKTYNVPGKGHRPILFGSRVDNNSGKMVLRTYQDISQCEKVAVIEIEKGWIDALPIDTDGDGIDELAKINTDNCADLYNEKVTYKIYDISKEKAILKKNFIITYQEYAKVAYWIGGGNNITPWHYSPIIRKHIAGNFLGNGKNQMLSISLSKDFIDENRQSQLNMICFDAKKTILTTNFTYEKDDLLFIVDYDGDGKAELARISGRNIYIYSFSKNSLGTAVMTTIVNGFPLRQSGNSLKWEDLIVGDLNGDGKTDFLVKVIATSKGSAWQAFYSTNNMSLVFDSSITNSNYNYFIDFLGNSEGAQFFMQDVNRDGAVDIIKCINNKTISCHLGSKDGKFNPEETAILSLSEAAKFVPNNIFQNNQLHQLLGVKSNKIISIISRQNKTVDNLLSGSINSLGVINKHAYTSITEKSSNVYELGSTLTHPYNPMRGDMFLLNNNSTYIDGKLILSSSYRYKGGTINVTGKGFLGYEKIETTDNIRNTKTTQVFDPKNFGVLRSADSPTMSSAYNYNVAVENNKIAKITLSDKTEKDKLKGLAKTTAYTYDTYGLPLTEVVDYGGNIKTTTCNLYNNYNTVASYRLGVVKETSIKEERGSDYAITRTVYSDFNSQYLPKIKIEYYKYKADTEMQISQESYIYDAQNNLTQKLIKPYSSTISQTVNYTYDNYGRITSETDPLGLKVSYTYNNTTGLLEKSTNNKGQNTTYSYDAWGRNIKTTYPDGTTESIKMQWAPATGSGIVTDTNTSAGTHIHVLNLSTAGTQGGTITACESISLKPGFSYSSAKSGSLVLKVDPTVHADSPPQYTNVSAVTYLVTATKTGTPMTQAYYDALGREIRTGGMGFDGKYLYTDCQYDNRGRLSKVSQPFKGNAATKWNVYEYDNYDRIISLTNEASGKKDTYTYPLNRNTETSLIDGVSVTKNYDNTGMLSSVSDPGGTISYTYRADGQISNITVPGGIETRFTYDKYGRKETIDDPSAGIRTYVYNSEGNIREERDARGANYITSMTYDSYNRLKTKTADGITTTINYAKGADGKENGLVQSVSENNGISTTYTYDTYDRILSEKRIVADGKSLEKTYSYNGGNISAITYKSNSGNIGTENYLYSYGSLNEIKLGATSIWSLTSENDLGLLTVVKTGNLTRSYGYDANGLVMSRIAKTATGSVIQNQGYNFDPGTMNLKWRKDNTRSALPQENFTYDGLNRLKTSTGNVPFTMTYNNSTGNITEHSIVGAFTYGQKNTNNKIKLPYSITGVTPYNSDFSQEKQTVAYNTMMRPSLVTEGLENTDTFMSTTFKYNGDGDRVKMVIRTGKNESPQLVRYYISGQYEQDSGVAGDKERLYLAGDAYSAPAVYIKENGNWQVKYILRDYMGSITHLTDASGKVQEELSYDPWGRMRNPDDHTLYAAGKEPVPSLGRGYTGHEHLGMHGLINMNARLYDPVVGRFLSPDPYVQAPDFSQNFNRYSYALNNPLKYTDPNGENPFLVFGLGFLFGYAANGYHTGDWGWSSVGSGVFVGTGMGTTYAMSGGGNPWVYSAQSFSMMIDPLNIGMGDFTLSLSPYSMLTGGVANQAGGGYAWGAGVSLGYNDGKTSLYASGIGAFRNGSLEGKFSVGGGYKGYSLYLNYYTGRNQQFTGTIGIQRGKFSMRWENDAISGMIPLIGKSIGGDRFRSNAIELGLGDYFVGTNVYTDFSMEDGQSGLNRSKLVGTQIPNWLRGKEVTSYPNAYTRSSPLYIGKKSGSNITRIGVNNSFFGDLFQNGFHFLIGSPYFGRGNFTVSPFYQTGSYSPSIMY